jgi:hypothetical protein
MNQAEIVQHLAEFGITGPELLKVGGAAFAMVLFAFFTGWVIGIAANVIRKV